MKLSVFSAIVFFLLVHISVAQQTINRCGSMEVDQRLRLEDPNYAQNREAIEQFTQQWEVNHPEGLRTIVTVPVVVHVVYNTTAQNISDAQVQAQIDELNEDYARINSDTGSTRSFFKSVAANTGIQFCLAQQDPSGNATNGIVHVSTTKTSFSSNDNVKHTSKGGDDAWNSSNYLNLWVCNLGSGLLGYAQFPGGNAATDGVVVLYSSVGSIAQPGTEPAYDLGRTATHEIGHWLNCYHIWGDDGTACTGSDFCADTPNQGGNTFGCPLPTIHISCSNGPNGDQYENYMDYTDDACMDMFTADQSARMQALFAVGGARVSILTSPGCTPPNGTCAVPGGLNATSITSISATINWSVASGALSYNIQYKPSSSSTWTSTTSTTTSKSLTGLTVSTQYDYEVQSACSGGSTSSFSSVANFTTTATTCSDILEPNNTKATAKAISVGTDVNAEIATSTDVDYYSFANTTAQPNIKVSLTNLPANYNIALLNPSGTKVASSNNSGTTAETIKWNNGVIGTYKVKVNGVSGSFSSTSCYDLRVDLNSVPWRSTERVGDQNSISLFPNPAQTNITVVFNNPQPSLVRFNIYNMTGQIVKTVTEQLSDGAISYELDLSSINSGFYLLEMINGGAVLRQKFEVAR
ncbi:MAG: T9SS type A sorting domain-containing protein [Chitinophagales bacterium]